MEEAYLQFTVAGKSFLQEHGILSRRKLVEVSEYPSLVGVSGCRIPGAKRDFFRVSAGAEGFELEALPGVSVIMDGDVLCGGAVSLKAGMQLEVDGLVLKCHVHRPSCSVSGWSQSLARFSRIAVVFFVGMELWVMLGLPVLLRKSDFWESDLARQRITRKLDILRKRVTEVETRDEMFRALCSEISQELLLRSRYLRLYEDRMRRRDRRQMLSDIERFEALLDHLEQKGSPQEMKELDLDSVVRDIISEE